jgi:transposase
MGVLRSYLRQRDPLIADATRHIQRMQKALSQMKLHLHRVLSAVTGWSGMRILKAIVTGERAPHTFALLKHERVKATDAEIAAALSGNYWEEHLFVLQQALVLYESYQQQIAAWDGCIEAYLAQLPSPLAAAEQPQPQTRGCQPVQNQPSFDLKPHLHRISGVDVCAING